MLLIDPPDWLFRQTVGDMPMPELRSHARLRWQRSLPGEDPVITTLSSTGTRRTRLSRRIHANAPHAQYVAVKADQLARDSRSLWRR